MSSRSEGKDLIVRGRVRVGGSVVLRPAAPVRRDASVEVTPRPYVSRGGEKLAGALDRFGIDPSGREVLDAGASTGGFTDCLLQRGASRVVAVDVGRGQLHPRLRSDRRVEAREGTDLRDVDVGGRSFSLIVADLAFVSLCVHAASFARLLAPGGDLVVLVKPQFEVGRRRVGAGGVVRDAVARCDAVRRVARCLLSVGLGTVGVVPSPVTGTGGNQEFFLWARQGVPETGDVSWP